MDDISLINYERVVKSESALGLVIVVTILRVVKHKAVVAVVTFTLVTDCRGWFIISPAAPISFGAALEVRVVASKDIGHRVCVLNLLAELDIVNVILGGGLAEVDNYAVHALL